jgi:hypothetical protein
MNVGNIHAFILGLITGGLLLGIIGSLVANKSAEPKTYTVLEVNIPSQNDTNYDWWTNNIYLYTHITIVKTNEIK